MANKTMSPSEGITAGQVGKLQELLGAALRKSGLQNEPVQQVLQGAGKSLVTEIMAVVQKYVDAVSNLITRTVLVDRTRTPQEVLDATKLVQYTDHKVVDSMPKGEGEMAEVVFLKLGHYISDDNLDKELDSLGFKLADPYSLAAVNEADPAFAYEHPNGTHWKDVDGKWCFASFDRRGDERDVDVGHRCDGFGWGGGWWFACVRK